VAAARSIEQAAADHQWYWTDHHDACYSSSTAGAGANRAVVWLAGCHAVNSVHTSFIDDDDAG